MNKIFLILFSLGSVVGFSQSDAANQQAIDSLKTNIPKKNNATFLWRLYKGLNDSKINKDSSVLTLTTTGTSGAATYSGGTLNVPQYTPSFPVNANGVLKNDGSGTLTWITDLSIFSLGTAWTNITLINGWVNQAGNVLQYRTIGTDIIELRGILDGTSASSDQFASGLPIPQGSGGNVTIVRPIVSSTAFSTAIIQILNNGDAKILSHASTFYSFNGLSYTK